MLRTTLSEGPIGERHGEMHTLVRNPFKTKFMRANYEAAVKTYDIRGSNFIYPNTNRRCVGNAWANNFWRGFDGVARNWDHASKQTPAYAMWCAGRDIRQALSQ